jgi:hypothetical protein
MISECAAGILPTEVTAAGKMPTARCFAPHSFPIVRRKFYHQEFPTWGLGCLFICLAGITYFVKQPVVSYGLTRKLQ